MIKLMWLVILLVEIVVGAVVFDDNATNITLEAKFNLVSMLERNNTAGVQLITFEEQKYDRCARECDYTLTYIHTDELELGRVSDRSTFCCKKDIVLTLTYPGIVGTVISSITLTVMQSSNQGDAFILSGGIGQQHALILVEILQSTYYSYTGIVFGHLAVI